MGEGENIKEREFFYWVKKKIYNINTYKTFVRLLRSVNILGNWIFQSFNKILLLPTSCWVKACRLSSSKNNVVLVEFIYSEMTNKPK